MKTRAWFFCVLVPALALAQQPPDETQRAADAPAREAPRAASFSTNTPEVRQILRDAAITSESDDVRLPAPSTSTAATDAQPRDPGLALRFRAPRRVDRMKCNGDECVALAADGTELYTVSEDGRFRNNSWTTGDYYDAWLSCQSTNNLLTTFERFDKCRGINIGIPAVSSNLTFALPRINTR